MALYAKTTSGARVRWKGVDKVVLMVVLKVSCRINSFGGLVG